MSNRKAPTRSYGNPITSNIRTGTPERGVIRPSVGTLRNAAPAQVYTSSLRPTLQASSYLYPQTRVEPAYTTSSYTQPRLSASTRTMRPTTVIGVTESEPRFIEERYVGERITNITHRNLEERIVSSMRPEPRQYVQEIETYEDEPEVRERIVEKEVEVLVEKRVPVHRYVDVPYDVIVERPIEKIIEKEIEIEKIMERQIQKMVEIPIERIVQIPYERIVEKPVEYEVRVERPFEKIVEKRIEDYYENLIYHDNYMEVDMDQLDR